MDPVTSLECFGAYDIRGKVPDVLSPDLARKIAAAYAKFIGPGTVAVGYDIRLTSPDFAEAVIEGLVGAGMAVKEIGLCGTEEVYFATFSLELNGGVMITASHNPMDYNGLKLVREGGRPISSDTGLKQIEQMVLEDDLPRGVAGGSREKVEVRGALVDHLLGYVDRTKLKPYKIVINAGNGGAGLVMDQLRAHLPFEFVELNHQPDGSFPNGIPNPLLPDNRQATADAVMREGADLGIAWDGDFDRCFLFDEKGTFIEGYYIVGLLAERILSHNPGGKIVHDPRMTWNTIEIVNENGGVAVQSKSGHAFVKEVMRREDAVYGGEMSAHHFFREFSYCDSGMIPWMLVTELMSVTGKSLGDLIVERIARFPASGEINRRLDDPVAAMTKIRAHYDPQNPTIDETDGLSFEFDDWRFNLRLSNTEPLIRLNVESRGDRQLMETRTREVLSLLDG
jgi:phosphomannomutase